MTIMERRGHTPLTTPARCHYSIALINEAVPCIEHMNAASDTGRIRTSIGIVISFLQAHRTMPGRRQLPLLYQHLAAAIQSSAGQQLHLIPARRQ